MKNKFIHILFILLLLGTMGTKAQQFTEYEVKAAYIFNFTKFINWPQSSFDNSTSPYVLGIYGKDPFGGIIKKIIGNRQSNGKKWIVKYYNKPEQIKKCHILFITNVNNTKVNQILETIKNKPILSVGDELENFCEQGGLINFTHKNSPKRFEINNIEAKKVHLSISSKLLMLSKIIITDEIKF